MRASIGQNVKRVSSHVVARWLWSPGCCGFRGVFWVRRDFFVLFFLDFFFFERTRPSASMRPHCFSFFFPSTGVRTGCHYLISLSVCVRVCATFVVFTDCESCTWPISTNSGSMEAGECGRTRGTCFITCRLEVVAVTGLLWRSWCVFGGADF